ncbi:MAG: amidohydrolase family protein [Verrucomicrobia bacterium]|nr:amidohydrolase family protein [Verrucomicrobiota bacterium]
MLIRGKHFVTGQVVDVRVNDADGVIADVAPPDPACAPDLGGGNVFIAPGFLDIHINGFAGVDFQNPALTADDLARATREQLRHGTTQYLVTIVSEAHDRMAACFRAVSLSREERPELARAIPGFHLEGPYISAEDGPRGGHYVNAVRLPSWEEFQRFQEAAGGRIKLVTVAPELPGMTRFIEQAVISGVVVGIGHTAANEQQIADAVAAGATVATHLGNGSHAVLPRHANYIQVQLAEDRLNAAFIADGHHLPPYVVKNFIRAKGVVRSILVTDAVPPAGMPPGVYRYGRVEVEAKPNGLICLPGTPYLFGAATTLENCVANVIAWAGVSLADAVRMVTDNPARLLGLAPRVLEKGGSADLILFALENGRLRVTDAVVGGQHFSSTP